MRIIHRISLNATKEDLGNLSDLGVVAKEGFFTFEVDETDPRWPGLSTFVKERRAVDAVWSRFSSRELDEAEWLVMVSTWFYSYPQPEDAFGFLALTYDLTNYCSSCGVGAVQKAPFRIKKGPAWGNKHLLQLNWVFDEFFARPETWKGTFEPHGISHILVEHHKTGKELTTIVQLKIDTIARSPLRLGDSPSEICARCGRMKYAPDVFSRGRFPSLASFPDASAFKTSEYFGSGARAFRATVISRALYRDIVNNKLRGITFKPLESG